MGLNPIPPLRPRTAAQRVRDQFVAGERDLDGLERGLAWLMLHGLDESYQQLAPDWPPPPVEPEQWDGPALEQLEQARA